MKKALLILTTGVSIEFKQGDEITVNGKLVEVHQIEQNLKWVNSAIINHITHRNEKVFVTYSIPSDKISWMYVQEVPDETITDSDESKDS